MTLFVLLVPSRKCHNVDTEMDIHISAKQSAKLFQTNLEFNIQHRGSPGLNSLLADPAKIVILPGDKAAVLSRDNHVVTLFCKEQLGFYCPSIQSYYAEFLKIYPSK